MYICVSRGNQCKVGVENVREGGCILLVILNALYSRSIEQIASCALRNGRPFYAKGEIPVPPERVKEAISLRLCNERLHAEIRRLGLLHGITRQDKT